MVATIAGERPDAPIRHGKFELKGPFWWTLAWLVVGLSLNLSGTWLYQRLWILSALIFYGYFFWGAAQAMLFASAASDGRSDARLMMVVQLVLMVSLFLGAPALRLFGDKVAFVFLRPAYDRAVAQAPSGPVVFPWTNGIPDGGSAIVFDPTDAVARITSRNADQMSPSLGRLLNGSPHRCDSLAPPHYYLCSFG